MLEKRFTARSNSPENSMSRMSWHMRRIVTRALLAAERARSTPDPLAASAPGSCETTRLRGRPRIMASTRSPTRRRLGSPGRSTRSPRWDSGRSQCTAPARLRTHRRSHARHEGCRARPLLQDPLGRTHRPRLHRGCGAGAPRRFALAARRRPRLQPAWRLRRRHRRRAPHRRYVAVRPRAAEPRGGADSLSRRARRCALPEGPRAGARDSARGRRAAHTGGVRSARERRPARRPGAGVSGYSVRLATPSDAEAICRIYNQGIEDRLATLETELRTPDERRAWMAGKSSRHPVIVAENERGEVVGWGSLNAFNARDAYRHVADISVYAERGYRGKGVGSALLSRLIELGRQHGFHKLG